MAGEKDSEFAEMAAQFRAAASSLEENVSHANKVEVNKGKESEEEKKFFVGDRVSAQIEAWDRPYEGVVAKDQNDGTFRVEFDDGEIVENVKEIELKREEPQVEFKEDDRIEAKLDVWGKYFTGKVEKKSGHGTYKCVFDDGEVIEYTPWNRMRKERPQLHPKGTRVIAKIAAWKQGYPGTISAANLNRTYEIAFDDGEVHDNVSHEEVQVLEEGSVQAEDRIEAKISGWNQFYPGKVLRLNEDGTFCVHFDDGEIQEAVQRNQMKILERKSNMTCKYKIGDRVEAQIPAWDRFYPGEVKKINENCSYCVHFDDGEVQKLVFESQLRVLENNETACEVDGDEAIPAETDEPDQDLESNEIVEDVNKGTSASEDEKGQFKLGDRVEVQIPAWDRFFPGELKRINSDGRYCIRFDDGEVIDDVEAHQMQYVQKQEADSSTEIKHEEIEETEEPEKPEKEEEVYYPEDASQDGFMVFLCRFKGILLRRLRTKSGAIDVTRILRLFDVETGKDSIVSKSALRKGVEKFGLQMSSEQWLDDFGEKLNPLWRKEGWFSLDQLANFLHPASGYLNELERRIREISMKGKDLQKTFREFDLDGSGKINASEICQVFEKLTGESIPREAANAIVKEFDVNGDMELDEEEFMRFVAPDFGTYVLTPFGQFFMSVDPSSTIATFRKMVVSRISKRFGVENARSLGIRPRFARNLDQIVLEPPEIKSAMRCIEVLSNEEQIWVSPQKGGIGSKTRESSRFVKDAKDDGGATQLRLQELFQMIGGQRTGKIPKEKLLQTLQKRPEARKLLQGSFLLSGLLRNPEAILGTFRGKLIALEDLSRVIIPSTKMKGKKSKESVTRKKWQLLKKQAEAAREFVEQNRDSGQQELAEQFEDVLGREELDKLSQSARARLFASQKTSFDMNLTSSDIKNEFHSREDDILFGQSPTDTQQWVNALSSDKWLGVRYRRQQKKHESVALAEEYVKGYELLKDPGTWKAGHVQIWLDEKLELGVYKPIFQGIAGRRLLSLEEEDLIELGMNGTGKVGLHRKKILSHIQNMKEFASADRMNMPREWSVGEVQRWLKSETCLNAEDRRRFKKQSVDGAVLSTLNRSEMRDLLQITNKDSQSSVFRARQKLFPDAEMEDDNDKEEKEKEEKPSTWKEDTVRNFISNVYQAQGRGEKLETLRAFKIDGDTLLSLSSAKQVRERLGIRDEDLINNLLVACSCLRKEENGNADLDQLILDDIQKFDDEQVPRGSGRQAAQALREDAASQIGILLAKPCEKYVATLERSISEMHAVDFHEKQSSSSLNGMAEQIRILRQQVNFNALPKNEAHRIRKLEEEFDRALIGA